MKKVDTTRIMENVTSGLSDTKDKVPRYMKNTFSFKGRKSPDIIGKIIETFTDSNDKILDPFLGSGTTLIASRKTNRKFMGIELDNYTYSVDKTLFEKVNKEKLNEFFTEVKRNSKDKVMDLYTTECCGKKNFIKKILFDPINGKEGMLHPTPNREIKEGRNVKLLYKCDKCGRKEKKFSEDDWKKILEIEKLDDSEFPKDKYIANSRINITKSTGADKYDRIFSHRNRVALLMIQHAISKLPISREREFIQQALVSSLSLSRIAMYGSSTDILYHVLNSKAQDMNAWVEFENKYKSFIKFQKENNKVLTKDFSSGSDYSVYNDDYYKFLKRHKEMKFNAIITDFPYTDQVPYIERNQLFRVWLNHFDSNNNYFKLSENLLNDEMVVTNAENRKEKNLDNYYDDLDKMFKTFSEHLNVGSPVIIITKLGKKKYFNVFAKVIDYAKKNGFEYTFRVGLRKDNPTLRKQSAYKNTLINEVVIGFEKLPENKRYLYIGNENFESTLIDDVYRNLKKVDNTQYTLTKAVLEAKKKLLKKCIHIDKKIELKIINIIKNNFYVDGQFIQLDKKRLYLNQEDSDTLFKKLYELVPVYVNQLLKKKRKFVLEDLYIELIDELSEGNSKTLYSLLNDDRNIREIDELIADKTDKSDDGKYYIKKKLPTNFNKDAIDIATMDPYDFERLCKKLLKSEGYSDVNRKGGSGDMGVDIVAKYFNGNSYEVYFIQCKRWISKVDSTPIQRLVSERERLGADKLACFTTSGYSNDAKRVAKYQNVILIDGKELIIKLNRHFPGRYYNSNI